MSKYYPIEVSKHCVNSIINNPETGEPMASDAYQALQQMVLSLIGTSLTLNKEAVIEDLLKFFGDNKYSSMAGELTEFIKKAVSISRSSEEDCANRTDCANSILLPFIFEQWQQDKIVLQVNKDIWENFKGDYMVSFDIAELTNLSFPIWLEFSEAPDKNCALLHCQVVDGFCYIVVWFFDSAVMDGSDFSYSRGMIKFAVPKETDDVTIELSPSDGIDSSFIALLLSYISKEIDSAVYKSEEIYKRREEDTPVKNKYSEVRIWELK